VCCSVLPCVAVCCSMLQYTIESNTCLLCISFVCSSVLQCVMQCVAVCCSVLQCVAVCCSVLQCVAVCYSMLQWATLVCDTRAQCDAVCCSVLQYVVVCYNIPQRATLVFNAFAHYAAMCCSVMHCVAVCCSMLQYTIESNTCLQYIYSVRTLHAKPMFSAVCCSVLQCATVCFSEQHLPAIHLLSEKIARKANILGRLQLIAGQNPQFDIRQRQVRNGAGHPLLQLVLDRCDPKRNHVLYVMLYMYRNIFMYIYTNLFMYWCVWMYVFVHTYRHPLASYPQHVLDRCDPKRNRILHVMCICI